jgi:hypothetical protein
MSDISEMIKYQTFPDETAIDLYYDEKEQKDYEICKNNNSVISEGFFRNLDGKDRKTKTIILSAPYRIIENKIEEYKINNSASNQDIPNFRIKLKHIQDLMNLKKFGAVYHTRGACGVFTACCLWFNIYEIVHNNVSVIWTELIYNKILKTDQVQVCPKFYDKILQLFNECNILLPINARNGKNTTRSYEEFLNRELGPLSIHENPLFIGTKNELISKYHMRSEKIYTFRLLTETLLKQDGDVYIVNIDNYADLIFGIVSDIIKNIEWIQFGIGLKMPRYNEIRYTKEKMPYIPVADFPLALCSMPYVGEKRVIIKFKQPPNGIDKVYLYCQNHTDRDQLILMPLIIPNDRIRISGGGIGIF